jgi:hypothetical protein
VRPHEISVFDRPDPLPGDLNYQRQTLRQVRIVGETVELEAGNRNGLFEAYGDGSRRDLRRSRSSPTASSSAALSAQTNAGLDPGGSWCSKVRARSRPRLRRG